MDRHDLVFLRPGATFRFPCGEGDSALTTAVRSWIDGGLPLVAARQPAECEGLILGLALPLSMDRRRVTCIVEPDAVARVSPPLSLGHCLDRLPVDAAKTLDALDKCVAGLGGRIGVYGSLAWETVSGAPYRHADSDIDLICDVRTHSQFRTVLAALAETAPCLPFRLDGEIRFPDGHAVAWREIHACRDYQATVLAKDRRDVRLLPLQSLLNALLPEFEHA